MTIEFEPLGENYDGKRIYAPVVGKFLELCRDKGPVPFHQHHHAQLVLALRGGVTCEVPTAIWMIPPGCAVWIPEEIPHSLRTMSNAWICNLFLKPGIIRMASYCCTLSVTHLIRELILDIAAQRDRYGINSPTGRKVVVLLEEMAKMPVEHLHLPISNEPRIQKISQILSDNPADRRTLAEWGKEVAMSESSLSRLFRLKTGLPFGRWRQQLHLIVAIRMLAMGESVQRVAEQLGYESVTAFIIMFKKALGKTPAKYFAEIINNPR